MKAINEMNVSFFSRSANEGFARASVAAFGAQLDPTVDELSEIKTAVSEAVTNCIVHAYRDTIGTIYIKAQIYEDGRLVNRVRDKGCGIENIEQAMEPMFTTGGEERSGLGFTVMQSFMDRVRVRSCVGKGTTVTLCRKLERRPMGND